MNSVCVAFELMTIELDTAVEDLNSQGARLFRQSDYKEARRLTDQGTSLREFCDRVNALAREWTERFVADGATDERGVKAKRIAVRHRNDAPRLGLGEHHRIHAISRHEWSHRRELRSSHPSHMSSAPQTCHRR